MQPVRNRLYALRRISLSPWGLLPGNPQSPARPELRRNGCQGVCSTPRKEWTSRTHQCDQGAFIPIQLSGKVRNRL